MSGNCCIAFCLSVWIYVCFLLCVTPVIYRQIALQLVRQGVISESAVAGEVEAKSEETSSDEETDESAADSGVKHEGSAKGAVRVMLSFLEVSFYLFIIIFFWLRNRVILRSINFYHNGFKLLKNFLP